MGILPVLPPYIPGQPFPCKIDGEQPGDARLGLRRVGTPGRVEASSQGGERTIKMYFPGRRESLEHENHGGWLANSLR